MRERLVGRTVSALAVAWIATAAFDPSAARAQERHGGHVHGDVERAKEDVAYRVPRWELGGGLAVAVPQGEFGSFVDEGFGLSLHAVYGLDPSNAVGLRLDAGFVNYGNERFTVPLLPQTGRILVDVRTRNNIAMFGIGPQLQVPSGPVRPYVNGFVGLGYFFTESSVGGSANWDYDGFASTLNFDDASFAYGAGGGLGLRLGNGARPIYLNFDAQYRWHGQTEYLREGSIVDDGFGNTVIYPLLSDADFLLFQVGVSVGL